MNNGDDINKYAPQERWQKKNGYISKSYKIKKEIVDGFAMACEARKVSQSSQLSEFMKKFIEETEKMT